VEEERVDGVEVVGAQKVPSAWTFATRTELETETYLGIELCVLSRDFKHVIISSWIKPSKSTQN
jgi:hypothetical protein